MLSISAAVRGVRPFYFDQKDVICYMESFSFEVEPQQMIQQMISDLEGRGYLSEQTSPHQLQGKYFLDTLNTDGDVESEIGLTDDGWSWLCSQIHIEPIDIKES